MAAPIPAFPRKSFFDQGLGDLFVIRVAGNIVAPSQIGSVEFAAARFRTALVVVLGHSQCGAILETLEYVREQPAQEQTANLRSIVDRIRPAVEPLLDSVEPATSEQLCQLAVRANVRASVEHLQHGSELLKQMVAAGSLHIVGAEYSLETGAVEII